jgi:hypothetical protein
MARSRRRRWIGIVALALLLLGGWLLVRRLMQPERLSAFLLDQAQEATGLEITLSAPADVGFWPDLHLELDGLAARIPGTDDIVLQAEAVEVVLPWSALGAETIQLRSLRLQGPVLDTEALSRWLESRSQDGPPAPFRLPQVDAAVSVASGRIQGEDWALSALDLSLPFLRAGAVARVEASGAIEMGSRAPMPFSATFEFDSSQDGSELRFESLDLELRTALDAAPWARIEGIASLQASEALHLDLIATLPAWPSDWPALPLPDGDASGAVRFEFDYRGTAGLQGDVALSLARGDADLRGTLRIGDVLAWLDDPASNLLPPLRGEFTSDRMETGGVELRGVRIRIDDSPQAKDDGDGR